MSEQGDFLASIDTTLAGAQIFPEKKPTHVYHYTTIEGLLGILSTGKIWATDLSYMNDTSEYVYADRVLNEVALSLNADRELKIALEALKVRPASLRLYAACFCESGDLLSQWRAYAGSGTGYAIEFDVAALERRSWGNSEVLLGRVEYCEQNQRELVQNIVDCPALKRLSSESIIRRSIENVAQQSAVDADELWRRVEAAAPDIVNHVAERVMEAVIEPFCSLAVCRAFLKSPLFREECEWRAIAARVEGSKSDLEFRPSRSMLVPYVPLPVLDKAGEFPISRIIIGPSVDPVLARNSLKSFLRSKGQERIQVDASSVPLR